MPQKSLTIYFENDTEIDANLLVYNSTIYLFILELDYID